MKLIIGLGNPGQKYTNNRHNLGYMCLTDFANAHKIKLDKREGLARVGKGEIGGETVILARSQTYMNESGQAVRKLVERYRLKPDEVIVIHDDMDLPLGKIRIRLGGGAAGHNGIKSIINQLGTPDFTRLRVGIGRPGETRGTHDDEVIDFVLTNFSGEEKKFIDHVIPKVREALENLIVEGLNATMNKYNRQLNKGNGNSPENDER